MINKEIIVFFDTETTGFTNKKTPDDDASQPHLVQLAVLQVHKPTRTIISSLNCLVIPESWKISQGAFDCHGITEEKAKQFGVPEEVAIDIFLGLQQNALRVAHNYPFDHRIIEIAISRYGGKSLRKHWGRQEDRFCTMKESKKHCYPNNLRDAHKELCGGEFKAHDAMGDAKACMNLYFAMIDKSSD